MPWPPEATDPGIEELRDLAQDITLRLESIERQVKELHEPEGSLPRLWASILRLQQEKEHLWKWLKVVLVLGGVSIVGFGIMAWAKYHP